MKTMKRVFALLLTAMVLCTLSAPAFAAAATGSITLKDATNVSVAGKTFNAYKILDATELDPGDLTKGLSYTVPAAMDSFYATEFTLDAAAADFDAKVVAAISKLSGSDLFAFAGEALDAAKTAGATGTATAGSEDASVTIDSLPLGYYVVEDVGAGTPISALVLDTVGNVNVAIKADKPTLEKKIDGDKDTDPSTSGKVESDSASIGDKIPYVLTSKVPDMTGYTSYTYIVHDTLSAGLTFQNDVAITIGGTPLTSPTDFTVAAEDGKVTITVNNFINYTKGQEIVITYSALVNEKAVIGAAGNPNEAYLQYSNNPNDLNKTENTTEEVTKTFVTELELTKVDSAGNTLTGAEFELTGTRLNTVLVTKDGTTSTITKTADVHYKGAVGADGKLKFTGLGAGAYEITELKAPNGYNILTAPISITIGCTLPDAGTGDATWAVTSGDAEVSGNSIAMSVVNKTGSELPSTGGIGTTIFYVVGGGLMLIAVVLLITKKRMADKE